jgi:hypothetical protein
LLILHPEYRPLAQSGSSLMRGFAAGVDPKTDIDAATLTQRSSMSS